jgi:hypothetical protein
MPEHLRALAFILALSIPTFFYLQKAFTPSFGNAVEDFTRRRNGWFFLLLVGFLSHNFWILMVATLILGLYLSGKDSHRLSAFLFLLFTLPAFTKDIPGFGIINYFYSIGYVQILALCLLLPLYIKLRSEHGVTPFLKLHADKFFLAYFLLQLGQQLQVDSVTNTMRYALKIFIEYFLPYYVASRSIKNLQDFKDVLRSLLIAILAIVPLAAFEYLRGWLLFSYIMGVLDVDWGLGTYLGRGGAVRAQVTAGQAIPMGFVFMVGIGLYYYVSRLISSRRDFYLLFFMLLVGLLVPVSRGPWLGAVVILAILIITRQGGVKQLIKYSAIAAPVVAAYMAGLFDPVINAIPFLSGALDMGTADYRTQLIEVSLSVLKLNLWFGSFYYLDHPSMQQMIQADGIIDMVNTYLSIAMSYGLVGLILYVMTFVCALFNFYTGFKTVPFDTEMNFLGRALVATMIGILVTIFTVSTITVIPWLQWFITGMLLSYSKIARQQATAVAGVR